MLIVTFIYFIKDEMIWCSKGQKGRQLLLYFLSKGSKLLNLNLIINSEYSNYSISFVADIILVSKSTQAISHFFSCTSQVFFHIQIRREKHHLLSLKVL